MSDSFKLPNRTSVFQAEVFVIWKASCYLLNSGIQLRKVAIATDSQASIKTLNSPVIKSQLVNSCLDTLSVAARRTETTLIWVPGQRNIEGNKKAYELAKIRTTLDLDRAKQVILFH